MRFIDKIVLTCGYRKCGKVLGTIETPAQVVGLGNPPFEERYIVATCLEHSIKCGNITNNPYYPESKPVPPWRAAGEA